jgi:hypothetical protein
MGTTPAQIASLGTSISWGKNSSDYFVSGFVGQLKTLLNARYGVSGEFISVNYSPQRSSTGTAPWVFTSVSSQNDVYGLCFFWSATAGTVATLTTPYACTAIDLVHLDYAAGTWTYAVDGGSAVTVTNTGSGYQKKVSITGLANTSHTVVLGAVSASNGLALSGASLYTGSTGIWLARSGYSGANATDYIATSPAPTDRPTLWQGIYAGGATGFGFPTQPHLAIIEFSVNDCTNGSTIANYQSALRRFCQALRRGQRNASILFVLPCYPDGVNGDTNIGGAPATYYTYIDACRAVADSFNAAWINLHALWGETPCGDGNLWSATDIHPSTQGHTAIAALLASLL